MHRKTFTIALFFPLLCFCTEYTLTLIGEDKSVYEREKDIEISEILPKETYIEKETILPPLYEPEEKEKERHRKDALFSLSCAIGERGHLSLLHNYTHSFPQSFIIYKMGYETDEGFEHKNLWHEKGENISMKFSINTSLKNIKVPMGFLFYKRRTHPTYVEEASIYELKGEERVHLKKWVEIEGFSLSFANHNLRKKEKDSSIFLSLSFPLHYKEVPIRLRTEFSKSIGRTLYALSILPQRGYFLSIGGRKWELLGSVKFVHCKDVPSFFYSLFTKTQNERYSIKAFLEREVFLPSFEELFVRNTYVIAEKRRLSPIWKQRVGALTIFSILPKASLRISAERERVRNYVDWKKEGDAFSPLLKNVAFFLFETFLEHEISKNFKQTICIKKRTMDKRVLFLPKLEGILTFHYKKEDIGARFEVEYIGNRYVNEDEKVAYTLYHAYLEKQIGACVFYIGCKNIADKIYHVKGDYLGRRRTFFAGAKVSF